MRRALIRPSLRFILRISARHATQGRALLTVRGAVVGPGRYPRGMDDRIVARLVTPTLIAVQHRLPAGDD
jgi:hypothetical protein